MNLIFEVNIKMQKLELNGILFDLGCKECLKEKYYLTYMCTKCNLKEFEGF